MVRLSTYKFLAKTWYSFGEELWRQDPYEKLINIWGQSKLPARCWDPSQFGILRCAKTLGVGTGLLDETSLFLQVSNVQ